LEGYLTVAILATALILALAYNYRRKPKSYYIDELMSDIEDKRF